MVQFTERFITEVLKTTRYTEENGWAFFSQFQTNTGSTGRRQFIDALAVGLWSNNPDIIVFEIKVSRSDFLNDVQNFRDKQQEAIANSTMFYYVAPAGIIKKEELPELAGLLTVSEDGKLLTVKVPVNRDNQPNINFFRAMARRTSESNHKQRIPISFLGRDFTREELIEYVDEQVKQQFLQYKDYQIDRMVRDKIEVMGHKDSIRTVILQKMLEHIFGYKVELPATEADIDAFIAVNAGVVNSLKSIFTHLNRVESSMIEVKRNIDETDRFFYYLKNNIKSGE